MFFIVLVNVAIGKLVYKNDMDKFYYILRISGESILKQAILYGRYNHLKTIRVVSAIKIAVCA